MKFAFLLPNYSKHVVGSTLVYYSFARELVARGHEVDIFHPCIVTDRADLRERLRSIAWSAAKSVVSRPVSWMEFPQGARPRFRPRLEGLDLDQDVVVAFSWRMVEALDRIRVRGRAFGYIVEYETWAEADPVRKARMETAYRKGVPLLCSSKVVESMLREVGAADVRPCVHGVDLDMYRARTVPEARAPGRIGFPVRTEPVKSPEVLEAAIAALRERFGDRLSLWGFGHRNVPASIRGMLDEYHACPGDRELAALYDGSSIFAVPSRKEGFGMPAAEAMSSGCAVVSTDNGGVRTYGVDGDNCVLVPPDRPGELAEAIGALVEDPVRRLGLAHRAPDSVRFLGWNEAGERFLRQIGS